MRKIIPIVFFTVLTASAVHAQENQYDREAELRIQNFKFEDDFKVELFADPTQVKNPSAICFDDQGRLYVGEIHRWRAGVEDIRHHIPMLLDDLSIKTTEDRLEMYKKHAETGYIPFDHWTEFADSIRTVEDTDGDGRADESWTYADGFDDPLDGPGIGLIYRDGKIYYTNIPHLWMLQDTDEDGRSDERVSLQEGFGVRMSISGHDMHGLAWGPDGRLYWSLGDRGYTITTAEGKTFSEPTEGAVFRCEPDGSNLEVYYYGLRNPQELAFDQYGNLFTCDNDADAWDTGRLVYILEGGDSGWDAGHQAFLNFHGNLNIRTPKYRDEEHNQEIALNPWLTERIWEPRNEDQPAWVLPPIAKVSWGPSGLCYNYGVTAFPKRYAEYFFVCNFGGAKGDLEAFAVEPDGAGFDLRAHTKSWMVGLGNTDADFGPDGKLYISSFNNNGWVKQDIGNIYTMFDPQAANSEAVKETQVLLTGGMKQMTVEQLAQHLGHEDMRVRQTAQFSLAKRGPDAVSVFEKAALQTENRLKRLHGIWGIGQVARVHGSKGTADILIGLMTDEDAEVRAQAAKTAGDLRYPPAGEPLAALLTDESNRVRSFAAIGTGRCDYDEAFDLLVKMIAANDNDDLFLRHGGIMGLYYLDQPEKVADLAAHESAAVRLAALLVLRRSENPEISRFLDDPDQSIVFEAIRAINDQNIEGALPELAKLIERGDIPHQTPQDWIIHTRLINANWRLGDEASARRLLGYAAKEKLPSLLRNDAVRAIESWRNPGVVDPTIANVRPLDPDKRADITAAVTDLLPFVLAKAEGRLLASSMRVASSYDFEIPTEVLEIQLTNTAIDPEVRLEALSELKNRGYAALDRTLRSLLNDPDAELRAAAARALMEVAPEKGMEAALEWALEGEVADRQTAFEILGESDAPQATEAIADALEQATEGVFPKGALLELLEAAEKHEGVAEELAAYRASLDPNSQVAGFEDALAGGDVERGANLFASHPAGQCMKCHIVGNSGGVAGPDLSDIGKRHKPEYILESIVNPTRFIVPGYGVTIVFLKDGTSVGGSILEETPRKLVLKVGEQGETQEIAKDDIQTMNPPISAMPPMGAILKKREIRDLVAYLVEQKAKPKGH